MRARDPRRHTKGLRWIAAALGIAIVSVCLTVVSLWMLSDSAETGLRPAVVQPDRTGGRASEQLRDPSMQLLLDQRALYEECRSVRQRMSQIEREWSASPSAGGDHWESTALELDRRLDDLRERIDCNRP